MEVYSGAFNDLGIEGFDFDYYLGAETFFSIDTLIKTIRIFEAEGVDVSDADFVQEWIFKVTFLDETFEIRKLARRILKPSGASDS